MKIGLQTNDSVEFIEKAWKWPGKSSGHPAVWHMLDVAACAEWLMDGHNYFNSYSQAEKNAFLILIALHDIGKISNEFTRSIKGKSAKYYHWQLSDVLLLNFLNEKIKSAIGGNDYVLGHFFAAVSGHHGGPERNNNRFEKRKRINSIGTAGIKFAGEWTQCLLELFPNASLRGWDIQSSKNTSWVLSGLVITADWIGSNEDWFPCCNENITPLEYFARARRYAKNAVKQAGLDPKNIKRDVNGATLIGVEKLHPMQKITEFTALPKEPFLAFVEDSTGSGKTEAAMILAHRMLVDKRADGLFFALPTTATSNAMFNRLGNIISKMYTSTPTLSLVHSKSHLHEGFRGLVGAEVDSTVEANCTQWLADNRRKSLLANVGTGTIDQVLLGILPTRFATLRLFGLANSILIVDEAHSYDPYMQKQLETLLKMHGVNGGSAIVMTATLPISMRQGYADAYCEGRGIAKSRLDYNHYPNFAVISSSSWKQGVEPVKSCCRTIKVNRAENKAKASEQIIQGLKAEASCVWIRNSVDDAILTAKNFITKGYEPILLHARFTTGDRQRIEGELINCLGKNSRDRSKILLISTQVIEASLDLDFDVMVSDLAPIGSLIQRAGRLWRHMDIRPESLRPVTGPVLNVLSPDPDKVVDDQWVHKVLDGGAWVYNVDHLWLTARILFDFGEIKCPDNLRHLIEAVHGEEIPEVPKPLEQEHYQNEGKELAKYELAQLNVIEVAEGYLEGTKGKVWSDERFPTRLGEENTTLVLARPSPYGLIPWHEGESENESWALSEVSCSTRRLQKYNKSLPNQSRIEIKEAKRDWPKSRKKHHKLCPVGEDGYIGQKLRYCSKFGLIFEE